jgi:rare lipoprotein A
MNGGPGVAARATLLGAMLMLAACATPPDTPPPDRRPEASSGPAPSAAPPLPGQGPASLDADAAHSPVEAAAPDPGQVVPEADEDREIAQGRASWYGRRFHGRRTASGERFDMNAMTAAHRTLPFGTRVRVRNPGNGREVEVRINDRGPHLRGRIIDLSHAAASALGLLQVGEATVVLLRP